MPHGYRKPGRHQGDVVVHHTFRTLPFGSGFAVACGFSPAFRKKLPRDSSRACIAVRRS